MTFHQTSVENLRKMLIDSGKYSLEQAKNIKGKANLVEAVMALNNEVNDILNSTEAISSLFPEQVEEYEEEMESPNYNSHEWHNHVMSHFQDDELVNGYPKIDGLRRVAELLLGSIVNTGPVKLESSYNDEGRGRAFCIYRVEFNWNFDDGQIRVFSASGGSYEGNTDEAFSIYPECIAETRAEARALRRALKLRIAAADEIKNVFTAKPPSVTTTGEWSADEKISSTQKSFLEKKCQQLNINVHKFINNGKNKYNNIDEVTKETAQKMIAAINMYQQNIEKIPKSLIGDSDES